MAINEQRTWAEVGAIITDSATNARVRDAFKNGNAEKVLLRAGISLYKFNDFPSLARGTEQEANADGPRGAAAAAYYSQMISPWWSPYERYRHDAGWVERLKLAHHLGVSIREFGRVTSAVKENWNSLKYLLVITLKTDAYGFFGDFAQMRRIDAGQATKRVTAAPVAGAPFVAEARGATANLPGGGTQFYLPNLRPGNVQAWRVESLLNL